MDVETILGQIASCSVTPRRVDGNNLDQLLVYQQEVKIQKNDGGVFAFSTKEKITAVLSETAEVGVPGAYQVLVTAD